MEIGVADMEKIVKENPVFFSDRTETIKNCIEYVKENAQEGDPKSICKAIDSFCSQSQENWLMNVGDEKGEEMDLKISEIKPKTALELGTYIGYSAVRFASLLDPNGTYVTIDVNPETTNVAREMTKYAKLNNVEFLLEGLEKQIKYLKEKYPNGFDFVFLDHHKPLYTPDLKLLEENGLVRKGTRVIGDNLYIPGNPVYIEYIKNN